MIAQLEFQALKTMELDFFRNFSDLFFVYDADGRRSCSLDTEFSPNKIKSLQMWAKLNLLLTQTIRPKLKIFILGKKP